MKPTKQQIEAALAWHEHNALTTNLIEYKKMTDQLDDYCAGNLLSTYREAAMSILATAYREKCLELERVQAKLSVANLIHAIDGGEKPNADF
jgi:hypothetical protein